MKIRLRKMTLVALGIAGAVCVSGLSGEAGESPSVATKTDRLAFAPTSGSVDITMQSRVAGASMLCRLPIQIQIVTLNIARPPRCN
jgi:hypothetical protein